MGGALFLLCVCVLSQDGGYYNGGYGADESQITDSLYSMNPTDTPTIHYWHTDLLVTDGQCSPSGNVTWSSGSNICNGTSYQSCMPDWPGIIHFKDLTPDDGVALTLQFELFGSFGCGKEDGYVQYTLNGVPTQNQKFIFTADWNCGCHELDSYQIASIDLNQTQWEDTYVQGNWNAFEIKSDPGVNLCLCGVTVQGSYYGTEDPIENSTYKSPSGTGYLWAFATLFCLVVAVLTVSGIIYYYTRKKKLAAEVDEFDVEFGE